jgi:hypothetical protein
MMRRAPDPQLVSAFRLVALAYLVTLYAKAWVLISILNDAHAVPVLAHPLFPAPFRSPWLATIAYVLPLPASGLLLVDKRWAMTTVAAVFASAAFALGWSLDTHNDATFITGVWTALWMLWFSTKLDGEATQVAPQAIGLAQAIVALVFLGGAVGKLTEAYTSGEVLMHLYMGRKGTLPWTWLREVLDPAAQRTFMRWFSRVSIALEGALALLPLYPVRIGAAAAVVAMVGIVLVSHVMLTSVMACLIGLMLAVWRLDGLRA